MSDYMFMLESHLNGDQAQALSKVREAAETEHLNLFLTGGAMRDMMAGFPIRDLDFTVEGDAIRFAKSLTSSQGFQIQSIDELRKSVEIQFGPRVRASISMARQEKYSKPGGKPQVQAGSIHDDLRSRDFTVNAIALSLVKSSRGLLLDPANGLGDLALKELRTVSNYALYDDPSRLFRLVRLKTRLGFSVNQRALTQFRNSLDLKLEAKISPATLDHELRQVANEPLVGEVLKSLEEEGLLHTFSAALTGPKLNLTSFTKLQKARQSLPFALDCPIDYYTIVLSLLLEKLSPKERSQLITNLGISRSSAEGASKLESRAAKLEKELAGARVCKPSVLYESLSRVPGEVLIYTLMRSGQRVVLDRIRNYFQKYLPIAQEVTEQDAIELGGKPGTAKFESALKRAIASRLDTKPKKLTVEEAPPPPPAAARRSAGFAR